MLIRPTAYQRTLGVTKWCDTPGVSRRNVTLVAATRASPLTASLCPQLGYLVISPAGARGRARRAHQR